MKKAFSLVELMFVMAILAIMSGLAINTYNESQNTKLREHVKNDLKRLISQENRYFSKTFQYEYIDPRICSSDTDDQGYVISENGVKFFINEGNCIHVTKDHCEDGTLGFTAEVWYGDSDEYTFEYVFHSCTSRKIEKANEDNVGFPS